MNDAKYIGMDVHQATISVAVRDARGNLGNGGDSRNESGYVIVEFISQAYAAVCR